MTHPIIASQFADVSPGIRLHYASCGDAGAPLLLFIHGFPEAWFEWERLMPAFGEKWFAVAPDLRGFNLSSKPAGVEHYKPKLIVQDMLGLIRALGYEKATVVAHDWGGAIAWNLAIHAPQHVERLVIINSPHPYLFAQALADNPRQQEASGYMNWLRKPGSESALVKDDYSLLDGFFTGSGQNADWYTPEVRQRYHEMWRQPGEAGSHAMSGAVNYYRASPFRPAQDGQPATRLALDPAEWRTSVPVRVIWGEQDRALSSDLLDGLDQVCSDLKVVRVPDAGHWVVHQKSEEIGRLLHEALEE